MKNIKILLYKEEQNNKLMYYIYSTETKQIRLYTQSEVNNIIANGERIRYLEDSKRNVGKAAVVYKSDPERYIVVTFKGVHLFRTLKELNYNKDLYFNVKITDDEVRSLDEEIIKADAYTKSVTYVDMYKMYSNAEFIIHKDSGEVDLVGYNADSLEHFRTPNFVNTIKSYSFMQKNISTLVIGKPLKTIETEAFKDSNIGSLIIDDCSVGIKPSAFRGCNIGTLRLNSNINKLTSKIFEEANIGILDLTYVKIKNFSYDLIQSIKSIVTIRLPLTMKDLDIDTLPSNVHNVVTTYRKLNIQCKDSNKLEIIKEKINSIPSNKKEIVIDILV